MTKLEQLQPADVVAGQPLPFDIFNANGMLLIRCGQTIASEAQALRLIERGAFADADLVAQSRGESEGEEARGPRTWVSIFDLIAKQQAELATLLPHASTRSDFAAAIAGIAAILQHGCELDSDAAIASILLNRSARFSVRHPVNTAILAELILRALEPDATKRLPALCAALTMNIAVHELSDVLYSQSTPLTAEQEEATRTHPTAGMQMLADAGVSDPVWLDAVAQHHETMNGAGYPHALAGAAIGRAAQVIGLADRYCASVSERAYRPGLLPSVALGKLFVDKDVFDPALAAVLVKEIGVYPPGSVVTLANGDLAVALKRTNKSTHPVVRVLVGSRGLRLPDYPKRSTSNPVFAVASNVSPDSIKIDVDLASLWNATLTDDPPPA